MKPALLLLCILVAPACGARVAGTEEGDASATRDTGTRRDARVTLDAASPRDSGPDCGQPREPTYDCIGRPATDAGVCHAYGEDASAGGPTYPLNCTVTLPTCDTSFGGAQTCNCNLFPGNGTAPTWICPI